MCDFKSLSFFLIILGTLRLSASQTPSKRLCFGELEIASFTAEVLFADANAGCLKYKGSLVKIGNAALQDEIRREMKVKPMYYIGAKEVNGQYIWLVDNTRVPLRGKSGYQNWRHNEPNSALQKCVAIGVHGTHEWSDVKCKPSSAADTNRYSYICQRGSENLLEVSKGDNQVICGVGADGIAIHWKKNSKAVKSSAFTNGIYQTFERNRAYLHFVNANISAAGTYECASKTDSCSAKKSVPVTVSGNPKITEIRNNKCNSSLFIKWRPAQAAVEFRHRVSVSNHISNINKYLTPASAKIQETEITGLNPDSNYTVKIQACLRSCETEFKAEMNNTTGGVTEPVSSAYLLPDHKGGCRTSWKHSDPDATFSLQLNCSVAASRKDEDIFNMSVIEGITATSYQFQPSPNRRCELTIQVKGCGKVSETVRASGTCDTPTEVPQFIKPLHITVGVNDASKHIKIEKPNEDNGLISCVFVILCYKKCPSGEFTIEDLEAANSTNRDSVIGRNAIVMALPMESISGPSKTVELSKGEITYCDVYSTGEAGKNNISSVSRLNGTFRGRNYLNGSGEYIGAFIVTTTPTNDRILLKSSDPATVAEESKKSGSEDKSIEDKESGNSLWVIGLVVDVLGAVIGIVSGIIITRRNQPVAQSNNKSAAEVQMQTVTANGLQKAVETQNPSVYEYENDPPASTYEEIEEPTTRPGYGEPSSYENITT